MGAEPCHWVLRVLPTSSQISCFRPGPLGSVRALPEVFPGPPEGCRRSLLESVPYDSGGSLCLLGNRGVYSFFCGGPRRGSIAGAFAVAADRPPVTRLGDDAGLVARRISSADGTAGPRLVSRLRARIHPDDQPGAGITGRAGAGSYHRAATVLDGAHPGHLGRCGRLGMVDLLGERGRLPIRRARRDNLDSVWSGGVLSGLLSDSAAIVA